MPYFALFLHFYYPLSIGSVIASYKVTGRMQIYVLQYKANLVILFT